MTSPNENTPKLDADEVRAIRERLGRSAMLRKGFAPGGPLTVVIDGKPCGSLDPNSQWRFRHEVGRKSEWVEVHDHARGGDLLLAAHLYRHDEVPAKGRKRKYSTVLEGGQKINFAAYAEGERAFVEISYQETKSLKALALFTRKLKNQLLGDSHRDSGGLSLVPAPVRGLSTRPFGYALMSVCLLAPLVIFIFMRPADIAHKAEPTLPAKERRDAKSIPDDPRPTPTPVQESSGEAPARAVSPDKGSGRPGHARGVPSPRTRSATVSFAPVSSTQLSPITLRLARRNLARDNRPSLVVNFAYEEARRTDSNARMMPVRIRPVAGTTRPLIRDNALGIGPPPYRDQ